MNAFCDDVTLASPPPAPSRVLLERIIHEGLVQVVFQPIVYLSSGELVGYEALVRGPSDSILHSPVALFAHAAEAGLSAVLDQVCMAAVLREFGRQQLPGQLFINVMPDTLLCEDLTVDSLLGMLAVSGLPASRVVLELTETRPNAGYPMLRKVVDALRGGGLRLALDDLGEGYSNLRLWSELSPELVKLDKYFVQNIHQDPIKLQFVRSLVDMARAAGSTLVAEGIELAEELAVLRDLGVLMGQGYLMARPAARPERVARYALPGHTVPRVGRKLPQARNLLQQVAPLPDSASCEQAYRLFAEQPECFAIPVLRHGRPVGLLSRHHVLESFAKPFNRELLAKKACMVLADPAPLVVPAELDVHALSSRLVAAERRYLLDGFIIEENGLYLGMGNGQDLMRVISEQQLIAARYANPLTGLPGNVPISDEVARMLDEGVAFVVAYVDLDYFKPFNDQYGYGAGDDMIRLLGTILESVVDASRDFVGHVGGDDFVLLLQSCNWLQRLQQVLQQFDQSVLSLFSESDRLAGGFCVADRLGQVQFFPLTSVSIGVLQVRPGFFTSHYAVASAATHAKKMAKKQDGSAIYYENSTQSGLVHSNAALV